MGLQALREGLTHPKAIPRRLLHPKRTLQNLIGLQAFYRMQMDGPTFFEFVTHKDPREMPAYVTELHDSDFWHTLLDDAKSLQAAVQTKAAPAGASVTAGYLDDHGDGQAGSLLYALVRTLRPQTVVETGVANGYSSAIILKAMQMNGLGKLYSVDLPPDPQQVFADGLSYHLPQGKDAGWLVPDQLRARWSLHLGDARDVLPHLLGQLEVDIFLHDSLHTEEHMLFEYTAAWAHLKKPGVLLSDDAGSAFVLFCRSRRTPGRVCGRIGAALKA